MYVEHLQRVRRGVEGRGDGGKVWEKREKMGLQWGNFKSFMRMGE